MIPKNIPLLYHIVFLGWEPLSAIGGGLQLLTNPADFVHNFVPRTLTTLDPLQNILTNELGAAYISVGAIQGLLLTNTEDLRIWRLLNIALLVGWDAVLMYSYWRSLSVQNRLDWATWRPSDWAAILITGFVGATRLAFAAGVGLTRAKAHAKRSSKAD
ncbi:unnamed protein product [Clonostachys byssicola]|uniref:DUF7704 domain-containing protein n=1 Tax=Clonostachys byssicola TaxID=160290 RepID=A0A9N9UYI6_9HYPO|nr:unnamed protein product [Clonostachys byssicola]